MPGVTGAHKCPLTNSAKTCTSEFVPCAKPSTCTENGSSGTVHLEEREAMAPFPKALNDMTNMLSKSGLEGRARVL